MIKITKKEINQLIPYENNPRINDDSVELVANSIKRFGFKNPVIIDRNNVIIAGHTRIKASKKLGIKEIPCVVADDLTEEETKALRLADNKTQELSTWEDSVLEMELGDIKEINMGEFGFETPEFDVEAEEDDFDIELPEEPKSQKGQIWKLGNHRLMCGDATSLEDAKKLMDGNKADLVFTDPPYNVAIGEKNKTLNNKQLKSNRIETDLIGDNDMGDKELGKTLWHPAFENMRKIANDVCSIYVTMPQGGTHMMMMMMMHEAGWQVKHELIWLKSRPTFSMNRLDYDYKHEPICYGWNKKHKFFGKGKFNKSVWEIENNHKNNIHPTMKPIELIGNAILNSSEKDDVVIDFFGGSGSTLIACEQLKRKCFMMELDPHYCDVIIQRWEEHTGEKAELI